MRHAALLLAAGAILTAAVVVVPAPAPARALTIPGPVCTVAGLFSGLAGAACRGLRAGGALLTKGKGLFSAGSNVTRAAGVGLMLAGVVAWVVKGGQVALKLTARAIGWSTRPQLQSSWFSASYWRMAAIAMLLTVPFLLAACVQAVLRSDMAMIGQAALGYLPLAVLAIMVAAPVTALLLAASDELCALISGAAGSAPGAALSKLALGSGLTMLSGSSFVALVVALITIAAGLTLWIELLIRSAAVYVIVLMLPVLFAALVWPARRVWAARAVEVLIALILSKFAIVAVLSLGASAIGQGVLGGIRVVAGATLVLLAAFSPWAVLRLLPLHELAAGAAAWTPHLRHPVGSALGPAADRAEGDTEITPGAPAVSPRGAWDAAHAIMAGLGRGGGAEAEVLAVQTSGRGGSSTPVSGGHDPMPPGAQGPRPQSDTADPASASGAPAAIPPETGSVGRDGTVRGDGSLREAGRAGPSPAPEEDPLDGERPAPVHEFRKPSIIFGDDFDFRPPEPGGVAPRPIEDDLTPPAERERDEPPMPPDEEHGAGPL